MASAAGDLPAQRQALIDLAAGAWRERALSPSRASRWSTSNVELAERLSRESRALSSLVVGLRILRLTVS